jgi:hypothetical protein
LPRSVVALGNFDFVFLSFAKLQYRLAPSVGRHICKLQRHRESHDLLSGDVSSAMGTETLLAHDPVPEGPPASSKWPAEQQIHHIGGGEAELGAP